MSCFYEVCIGIRTFHQQIKLRRLHTKLCIKTCISSVTLNRHFSDYGNLYVNPDTAAVSAISSRTKSSSCGTTSQHARKSDQSKIGCLRRGVGTWSPLAAAFNSCSSIKRPSFNLLSQKTGLFGYKVLQDPDGFYLLKEEAMLETDKLVREATSKNRTRKMVQIFDELSDTLCKVADMAEFVRIGHPQNRFATAAENASMIISGLVEKLNTNCELYNALKKVTQECDIVPTNPVDEHVAELFLFDFEQSGIHVDDVMRERAVELNEYILHIGSHFMNGTNQPKAILKSQLPENIRQCFSVEGDSILVTGLFADSENDLVREAAYKIYLFPDSHQAKLLDELLVSRNELAILCGFPTYAHRAVRGSLAGDPHTVKEFLDILSDGLRERAQNDYNDMLQLKRSNNRYESQIMSWDIPYYTAAAKQNRFNIKNSDFCPYFSLGVCMEGLNNLFQSLFGTTFDVEECSPGELWHKDVIKLSVQEEGSVLGYIYCDFFERPGKAHQDCHFTIQGGRQLENGTYQLPVVVLMLNLPSPTWSTPSLLTPGMVDNLFHEMGHAMHSMLARTPYQHVTGTRCATDLAEVPSILMEHFSSDPRVVLQFAKHYQTGAPIPHSLIEKWNASKQLYSASEIQLQVFYAALDQVYHGEHPLKKSTTEILADVQNQYYGIPHVPNTAWQLRFGHLVGYGAKYYAYIMSRAVASCIWQVYFKDNPFSSSAGERYRRGVLAHGGSRPPRELIQDFLQCQVTPVTLAESLLNDIDGTV